MTKIQLTTGLITVKDDSTDVCKAIFGDKQFIPLHVEYYNSDSRKMEYQEQMVDKFNIIKYWHE